MRWELLCLNLWWGEDRMWGRIGELLGSRWWPNKLLLKNRIFQKDGQLKLPILWTNSYNEGPRLDWDGEGRISWGLTHGLEIFLGKIWQLEQFNLHSKLLLGIILMMFDTLRPKKMNSSATWWSKTRSCCVRVRFRRSSRVTLSTRTFKKKSRTTQLQASSTVKKTK